MCLRRSWPTSVDASCLPLCLCSATRPLVPALSLFLRERPYIPQGGYSPQASVWTTFAQQEGFGMTAIMPSTGRNACTNSPRSRSVSTATSRHPPRLALALDCRNPRPRLPYLPGYRPRRRAVKRPVPACARAGDRASTKVLKHSALCISAQPCRAAELATSAKRVVDEPHSDTLGMLSCLLGLSATTATQSQTDRWLTAPSGSLPRLLRGWTPSISP